MGKGHTVWNELCTTGLTKGVESRAIRHNVLYVRSISINTSFKVLVVTGWTSLALQNLPDDSDKRCLVVMSS